MHERTVLLNKLICESKCRSSDERISLPIHGIEELCEHISKRVRDSVAIEYAADLREHKDDQSRIAAGRSGRFDFIRIKELKTISMDGSRMIVALVHHVDQRNRSFPVLHLDTYEGREIAAEPDERGVTSAHLAILLPDETSDVGEYRAVLEFAPGIPRKNVELLLNRQILRSAEWEISVEQIGKRGNTNKPKSYKYRPIVHLASEVYRNLLGKDHLSLFSSAVFTQRSTLESTAKGIDVSHKDIVADIELRVSSSQAPTDPTERKSWLSKLIEDFRGRGYTARLYYKHLNSRPIVGKSSIEEECAADRLICNTESYTLSTELSKWDSSIRDDVVAELLRILRKDELWQGAK